MKARAYTADSTGRIGLGPWRGNDAIALAVLSLLATMLLARSWGKWLESVIDTGRDLYIPEQIAAGHLELYRDILYNYPPFAPYLLAGIVKVFGSSLAVYTAIGITASIATAFALYYVGRITTRNLLGAAMPPLLFLSWNLTSATAPGANYIFPYSHAATIGMLLLLVYLAALLRYCFVRRSAVTLGVAFLSGGLAFWTKLEYAACVVVTTAVVAVAHRLPWRSIAAFAISLVGSFAALNLYFSDAPETRHWLFENIFKSSLIGGQSSRLFFSRVFGSTGWDNVGGILGGALLTIVMAGGLHLFQRVRRLDRWAGAARAGAQGVLVVVLVLATILLARHFLLLRGWTLLQLLLLAYVLLRDRKSPLLILLVFSISGSARVALHLVPEWYGFVYTVPLYAVIAFVLFGYLPEKRVYSIRASMSWLPLVGLFALSGIVFQGQIYGVERYPVVTRRGTFLDHNRDRAAVLGEFLRMMDERRADGLVVMPEGLTLNYLAGVPNPTAYYIFTPVEIASPVIEQRVLSELKRTKPELVVVITRDVREYGYRGFGVDYGLEVRNHLRREYREIEGRRAPGFGLVVLELNRDSRVATR